MRQCLEMYHMSIKKTIAQMKNNMIPKQQNETIQSQESSGNLRKKIAW